MNILLTILVLGILILIHELGHFLVAKFFKVHIETFSIGFGPKLFSFTKNGTLYKLSLIPIGGFVKMKEDDILSSEFGVQSSELREKPPPISEIDLEDKSNEVPLNNENLSSFTSKKWWERALIVFGGPAFNLLFALILIIFTFMIGRTYNDLSPIIESADYPYNEIFFEGDRIIELNGKEIRSWSDIFGNIEENKDNVFLIERKEPKDTLSILNSEPLTRNSIYLDFTLFIENRIDFFTSLTPLTSNIVGEATPGMPAWRAGVREGDKILMIDGVETPRWSDVRNAIIYSQGEYVVLTIQPSQAPSTKNDLGGENGEIVENLTRDIIVYPEINPLLGDNARVIGITQHLDLTFTEKYTFSESIKNGSLTTLSIVFMNYQALFTLAQNPSAFKNNVGGPIMIYYMTAQTTQRGFSDILFFMAAISILLMIMNLLPIPVFDGGHIMFFLFEGIFGKPIPLKIQVFLQQIGILLLVSLMIFAFYSDISRLWILNN